MIDEVLVRNFDLLKRVFDNLDILTTYYKLKARDINFIQSLLMKHNSFNAYIEIKPSELSGSKRTYHRALDKLENEYIITVVERPKNQHGFLKIYFTISFIKRICGDEFGDLYEKWLKWQLSFKDEKENEDDR